MINKANGDVVRQWMYYMWNFKSTQFQVGIGVEMAPTCFAAFDHDEGLRGALIEKWQNLCDRKGIGGTEGLLETYFACGKENQNIMVEWVLKNYTA